MYSTIIDGKVCDWKFKKGGQPFITVFYVGERYVGQIFKQRNTYSVVGKTPNKLCPVYGFATRRHAAEFLLKLEGIN